MDLSRYALYPHQVCGVEFLARRGRAILGDDMGLGKTRQAIIAMKEAAPAGVLLIICPASLKLNWAREISAVDPSARIEVLGVAGYDHPQPQWVIVNYDLMSRHGQRLRCMPWTGVARRSSPASWKSTRWMRRTRTRSLRAGDPSWAGPAAQVSPCSSSLDR